MATLQAAATAQRQELVRQIGALAAESLSAREIAGRLGLTRGAVLGLCHRNGIKLSGVRKPMAQSADPATAGVAAAKRRTAPAFRSAERAAARAALLAERAERRQRIRTLAAEGLSARQIAERLGVTRGTVLGECHRQQIRLQGKRKHLNAAPRPAG
jgi:hypothetical protein